VTSGNAGHSAFRRQPNQMHLGWDEVWIALPELSRNNAPEQALCDPMVAGMPEMISCTAVSEPIPVRWTPTLKVVPCRMSP
jgi:hypothetical protein